MSDGRFTEMEIRGCGVPAVSVADHARRTCAVMETRMVQFSKSFMSRKVACTAVSTVAIFKVTDA